VLRTTLLVDVQIDAVDGKAAQRLVRRSFADGTMALDNTNIRIKPLRGHPFARARIIKTRVQKEAILI
jgi:hypothetical protein